MADCLRSCSAEWDGGLLPQLQCLWPAVWLPRHGSAAGMELSNATSRGHPERGRAGGKGQFNNKLGREDELLPPDSSSVSRWLRRRDVCSWAVLMLGEVPGGQQSFMGGRTTRLPHCPAASCASVGCCKASPTLALLPPWERGWELLLVLDCTPAVL